MTDLETFDVLHVLRLKGIVSSDALPDLLDRPAEAIESAVDRMASEGLVARRETPRLSGWALTPAGRDRHAEAIAAQRDAEVVSAVTPLYERFLDLNSRVKKLSTSWQQLASDDAAGRWDAIEQLGEVHDGAAAIVRAIAERVPRFRSYERRLAAALEALHGGDERFFTGVTVDSFHTVWFECHEDLIQTLGRDRVEEGSF